ncbi:helix-turn-helix domain-containing protein [Clostridium sp. MT-14]|uniref:helix-turn-helix domain-containing protein n=1 Tax=Clostridium sp. MT-14 TaxID=3348360 RepID=UPI0035F3F47C
MIGDKIKNIRKTKGLSQKKLAEASGISPSYLQQLELGQKKNPSIDVLNKISKALDINIKELIPYTTEEQRNASSLKIINNLIDKNPQYKEKILDALNSMYNIIIGEFYKPSNLKNSDIVIKTLTNNLDLYRELTWELHSFSNDSFIVSSKLIKDNDFYKIYNLRDIKIKRINDILDKIFKNYLIRYGLVNDEPKESELKFIRNPNLP